MLKPFPLRVEATLAFMKELIKWTSLNKSSIEKSRVEARRFVIESPYLKYNYINSSKKDSILFKGYEHSFPVHKITGLSRLKYDTNKPYTKYVPFTIVLLQRFCTTSKFLLYNRSRKRCSRKIIG